MIKAIVFDLGGVIMNFPLREWFNKNFIGNDEKVAYKEITKKWDSGEINHEESLQLISSKTGIPPESVYEQIFKPVVFNPEMISLIKKLKKHYTIAIFSNNQSEMVKRMLSENNLIHLFDTFIVSSDHKQIKPHDAFYHTMLSILGTSPTEVIFIDDTQENVNAGNNLGIKSFLFTNVEKLKSDLMSLQIRLQ